MVSASATVVRTVGDLHVEVHGSGRPMLLIHGNSGDLRYFDPIVPALARSRRVVAMDCRGSGLSARGRGPLTLSRMADDAADVIRALGAGDDSGPEPFDVVGFSDGANIAMLLATRHPELVRSLVLNSGNTEVRGMRRGFWWGIRLLDRVTRMRVRLRGRGRADASTRRHEQLRLMLRPPGITHGDLARIAVPTLVLIGSRDVIRRSHSRMIARVVPGAQLLVIRGGTHLVMRQKPVVAAAVIATFLEDGRALEA
jgi:pimeloyl-ACP methyl ester carboxylesterase